MEKDNIKHKEPLRLGAAIVKVWCFLRGHDWLSLYTINNADIFNGQWRSKWGEHKCMRCGKTEGWQWDRS